MKKLLLGGIAVMALVLTLFAPAGTAEAVKPPKPDKPTLIIEPVASPLRWFDVSRGEDIWRKVTSVSYTIVGCDPGEYLYWADGPAYQDGRQAYGVFGGLGQGEDACKADGTSSYGGLWYREPRNLHPGWMTMKVTLYHVDNATVLAQAAQRVWIPRGHRR